MQTGSLDTESHHDHQKTIHTMFALYWPNSFRGEISYVKTMSADGGHLEFPIGMKKTFVEVHPRTIHAMFALNWFTHFREENFSIFSHRVLCKNYVR